MIFLALFSILIRFITLITILLLAGAEIFAIALTWKNFKGEEQQCGYLLNTIAPSQAGGIAFASINSIINFFVLLLFFFTEAPVPFLQQFIWETMETLFPPVFFSSTWNLTFPGLFLLWRSASLASRPLPSHIMLYPLVASWFGIVVGAINVLFLGFIPRIWNEDIRKARAFKFEIYSDHEEENINSHKRDPAGLPTFFPKGERPVTEKVTEVYFDRSSGKAPSYYTQSSTRSSGSRK